jgi:hypothetical protein
MKKMGIQVVDLDVQPWEHATESARQNLLSSIPGGDGLYKEIVAAKTAVAAK